MNDNLQYWMTLGTIPWWSFIKIIGSVGFSVWLAANYDRMDVPRWLTITASVCFGVGAVLHAFFLGHTTALERCLVVIRKIAEGG